MSNQSFTEYLHKRWLLLHLPGVFRYLCSCLLSTMGGGLSYIALTWLILQYQNSLSSLITAMLFFWVPSIIMTPWAGVWVDRYDRKRLYTLTSCCRGLAFIILGVLISHTHQLWYCYTLSIINGATFPLYGPITSSLIREIVDKKSLLYANPTIDSAYEIGNLLGMGLLAAIVLSIASSPSAIIFAGILLMGAGLLAHGIRRPQLKSAAAFAEKSVEQMPRHSFWRECQQGLDFIKSARHITLLYSIQAITMLAWMVTPALLAPYARNILHSTARQFGWIEASLSIGCVLGAVFIPLAQQKIGFKATSTFAVSAISIGLICFSNNHHIAQAYLLNFIIGIGLSFWSLILTAAQHVTPLELQGRAQAAFNTLTSIAVVIIYLLMYAFSGALGVAWLYKLTAGIMAINLLLIYKLKGSDVLI